MPERIMTPASPMATPEAVIRLEISETLEVVIRLEISETLEVVIRLEISATLGTVIQAKTNSQARRSQQMKSLQICFQ